VGARVQVSPLCAKSSSGMAGESGSSHSLAPVQPFISRWGHAVTEHTQTIFSILLIEDSDEDYLAFTRALRDTVVTVSLPRCTRGEEALDYLYGRGRFVDPARAPRPALVLLDLNLPGMDGRELLTIIKGDEHLKSIPVVIVTTSRNPRDVEWCYQHGANSYQVKAIGYEQFRNAMRLLVEYWLNVCVLPATAEREVPRSG
jgi:CheY-like chemotaxis protein